VLDEQSWGAGIVYDLPLDRVRERNTYRAAQIAHTRTLRDFDEFEDTLAVNLRNRFRTLRRIELSLQIQRESIRDEERNLVIAKLLFERGENSNRDVVEAEESLLEAQNALVREQVTYEIERLNVLRDMGILFIDEDGMWTE
jgi:outer membrane protein TolC